MMHMDLESRSSRGSVAMCSWDGNRDAFIPKTSIVWRLYRRLVKTDVQFFETPDRLPNVDILKLHNLAEAFPSAHNTNFPTIVIDLLRPEEVLWNDVNPKTRKVIRQASREGVTVVETLSGKIWNAFYEAYENLISRKNSCGELGVGQISELAKKNSLVLSISRSADNEILSWHYYARCHEQALLINTVSAIDTARGTQWNNLVGRANRLHHWQAMLRFKDGGIKSYDLGGVYRGTEDHEQFNIARFKSSFGGESRERFDVTLPLTGKGRIALRLAAIVNARVRSGK